MTQTVLRSLDELKKLATCLSEAGKTVVFTNGCFDVLHVGHSRCLSAAKAHGDVLIVGLNSDSSVRENKGQGRPVVPEDERAELLLALESVDYVYIFSSRTVDDILLTLQPEIYAKGTDYTIDTIPERDSLLSYGGKLVCAGDTKTRASSDIIERIGDMLKANESSND